MQLDHIMFAVNDLDVGINHIENLTGVKADEGGSHPGNGTRNALVALANGQYLEIIAPDPAQDISGTLGAELAQAPAPFIRTWAVATSDFEMLTRSAAAFGYRHHIVEMSRTPPDGIRLSWRLLFVSGHRHGLNMPFFIDWQQSRHPSLQAPAGCTLKSFQVTSADADEFSGFCQSIGLEVDVRPGEDSIRAELNCASGSVALR